MRPNLVKCNQVSCPVQYQFIDTVDPQLSELHLSGASIIKIVLNLIEISGHDQISTHQTLVMSNLLNSVF